MLTKYKDVRPKRSLNSTCKMFSCLRCIQEFFSGKGRPNLPYFQACFYSDRIILKHIENKKMLQGVRGHAPMENFRKFTYCSGDFNTF